MNLYWVYNLSNWQFGLLSISFFVVVACLGLILLRKFITSRIIPQAHNDVVSFFMAGLGAIYGITLGLIAVGAWENFNDVDNKCSMEASSAGALYQDVRGIPGSFGDSLRTQLTLYVKNTIETDWPKQQQGEVPSGKNQTLDIFLSLLEKYQPSNESQRSLLSATYLEFNRLNELRRLRLSSVTQSLPAAIWQTIFFGALLNIVITWFFVTDKFRVHLLMTGMFAALLGLLVFLVAAMDNPFRGEFSVGPDAFQLVLDSMTGKG